MSLISIFEPKIPTPKLPTFADSHITDLKAVLEGKDQAYGLNVRKDGLQKLQHVIIDAFLMG